MSINSNYYHHHSLGSDKNVELLMRLQELCLDGKIPACCVFFDLKKAFDTINHSSLLEKLEHMGFRGPVQKLFKSYLQDRKQYVQIGQNKSYHRSIMCGVPQGSVVGPLFFILYVNDLPDAAISRVTLFADDTTVLERIPNFNLSILNQTIRDIDTWMRKNRLKCNIDKSKAVVFANKVNLGLNFEEYQIAINPQLKYLGIVIDDKLTFCDHVLRLKNKLLFCNYIVLRTRNYLTRSQLLFLLYAC